eukprot:1749295-Amphidinium_carterae.1
MLAQAFSQLLSLKYGELAVEQHGGVASDAGGLGAGDFWPAGCVATASHSNWTYLQPRRQSFRSA